MGETSYELLLKVEIEGHYVARVVYKGQNIGPASGLTIICLTGRPHTICHMMLT